MVVTGDVTDKGVPGCPGDGEHPRAAALICAFRFAGRGVARVNELLIPQIPQNMFVTCLVMMIDLKTGRTQFANAGHNLPYLRRDGVVVTAASSRHAIGSDVRQRLRRGRGGHRAWRSSCCSTATASPSSTTRTARCSGSAARRRSCKRPETARNWSTAVVAALSTFSGSMEQEDDVTLVALEYRPARHRGYWTPSRCRAWQATSER